MSFTLFCHHILRGVIVVYEEAPAAAFGRGMRIIWGKPKGMQKQCKKCHFYAEVGKFGPLSTQLKLF